MRHNGVVRHTDKLGRLVIPSEYRSMMQIGADDALEVFVRNNELVIRKYQDGCVICGSTENLRELGARKDICANCIKTVRSL